MWASQLRLFDQFDVQSALNQHKATTPDFMPSIPKVLALCREYRHQRELSQPPQNEDSREYESTRQWIERTIASASPEEIEAVKKRVPMAAHMPGLIAAGIETIRKERKRWN